MQLPLGRILALATLFAAVSMAAQNEVETVPLAFACVGRLAGLFAKNAMKR